MIAKRLKKQPSLLVYDKTADVSRTTKKEVVTKKIENPLDTIINKPKSMEPETQKPSVKTLINKGKKSVSNDSNKSYFDYENETPKPNTFNFDYQPKLIKTIFDSIRSSVERSPNDAIISSIIATLVEKFSFFRVGTTYPFESHIITSNLYSITYAKSGAGKDFSARVTGELFSEFNKEIYKAIEWATKRYGASIDVLIKLNADDKSKVDQLKEMKYLPHRSYNITEATNEGLMANIETFMKIGVGSVTWKIQEMGDMLLQKSENSLSMDLVKALYDSSSTYNKQIKGGYNKDISGVPFNVVGYTSPQGLNDDENRKKINDKMARGNVRRFHMIAPIDSEYPEMSKKDISDTERLEKLKNKKESFGMLSLYNEKFGIIAKELSKPLLENVEKKYKDNESLMIPGLTFEDRPKGKVFGWTDEAAIYFDKYNENVNVRWHIMKNEDAEAVGDLGYKVIKLLPIYCILNGHDEITLHDLKQTIYLVEYFHSHTHNLKILNQPNSVFENNKIYDFLKEHTGEYYNKTELKKVAGCTTRYERSKEYLADALSMIDDDSEYEISVDEREYKGKVITCYSLKRLEEDEVLKLEKEPVANTFEVKL